MRLRGLGIVEGEPQIFMNPVTALPMPLPPQPPGEGYGYVSCLDHPEVENCYWPSGPVPTYGPVQGPIQPVETVTPPAPPKPSVFGDLGSLPPALFVGALIFFLMVASAGVRGKTVRSLVK